MFPLDVLSNGEFSIRDSEEEKSSGGGLASFFKFGQTSRSRKSNDFVRKFSMLGVKTNLIAPMPDTAFISNREDESSRNPVLLGDQSSI